MVCCVIPSFSSFSLDVRDPGDISSITDNSEVQIEELKERYRTDGFNSVTFYGGGSEILASDGNAMIGFAKLQRDIDNNYYFDDETEFKAYSCGGKNLISNLPFEKFLRGFYTGFDQEVYADMIRHDKGDSIFNE